MPKNSINLKSNLSIRIVPHPDKTLQKTFQKFADNNWGEQNESDDEEEKFFDEPGAIVVGYLNREVVGLLNLHMRNIEYQKKLIKLCGIGGVVTRIDHRRLGIGTQLLKQALTYARSKDFDIAMLCTDINRLGKFYTPVGFVPLKRKYYFIGKSGKEYSEANGMICAINPQYSLSTFINSRSKLFVGTSNF